MAVRRLTGWMSAVVVLAGLLATGCGSRGATSTSTSTTAPTGVAGVVLGPFTAAGGTPAQAAALLVAGCAVLAPADRNGDSATINGYFTDLFDGGSTGATIRRDRRDVDVALEQGCSQHRGDLEGFLGAVADVLALTPADVQDAIDGACAGYETRLRTNAGDGYAPRPLDDRLLGVLGAVDIGTSRAEALIEAYCGPI